MQNSGGVVEGNLHSECDEDGCGEKFVIPTTGEEVELEADEAVIIPEAFDKLCFFDSYCAVPKKYKMKGTIKQIASAINAIGGGEDFAPGAKVWKSGRIMKKPRLMAKYAEKSPKYIESGSVVINRTNMNNPKVLTFEGTTYEIASKINSYGGNGVKLAGTFEHGGAVGQTISEFIAANYNVSSLINAGHFKIGYRPTFLTSSIILGRQRDLVLPNGEKRVACFAIVKLDLLIPSHNAKSFTSSRDYPTNFDGSNINDRNYSSDPHAQMKVNAVAKNIEPSLIISTGVEPEGTPIITIDGVVVSGNNRTMSLKLARDQYPEQYDKYVSDLKKELDFGGYGLSSDSFTQDQIPVLVRIDFGFQSYLTEELNKYNVDAKKSERSIDMAIRIAQQLKDNPACQKSLINLVSQQETVSELYNSPQDVNELRKIWLECNLISKNELAKYFENRTLSQSGKTLYNVILSSLVLSPKALSISQTAGVKIATNRIVNAIIPVIRNKSFDNGSLISDIDLALLLQNKMIAAGFKQIEMFVTQGELFKDDIQPTLQSAVINYFLNQKPNDFKSLLIKYNNSVESLQQPSLIDEGLTPADIFQLAFVDNLPNDVRRKLSSKFELQANEPDPEVIKDIQEKIKAFEMILGMYEGSDRQEIEDHIAILKKQLN